MSDHTSAALFGELFKRFAKNPTDENKKIAHWFWNHRGEYDFNVYQMYCDEALVVLGLAHKNEDGWVEYEK
jgi:hypothetical protein